jgi:5-methylcytosine-specific restriction endonuclease McrA
MKITAEDRERVLQGDCIACGERKSVHRIGLRMQGEIITWDLRMCQQCGTSYTVVDHEKGIG